MKTTTALYLYIFPLLNTSLLSPAKIQPTHNKQFVTVFLFSAVDSCRNSQSTATVVSPCCNHLSASNLHKYAIWR